MNSRFGLIALLGSGETSLAGGRIFESIARRLPTPLNIAALETPAGFELNSPQVAGRVMEFLKSRLKEFFPRVDIIPARKRGTFFDPDNADILAPLNEANLIFMGPGSPTYAVRQLEGSLAWELLQARQRAGCALVFTSAADIAIGRWCLPVYEIYKVGEDVQAVEGLDLFADFGLRLSFIPHWNNADGGEDLDTSRCFVGQGRFEEWHGLLPPDEVVIGLDEHTGLIFDFSSSRCKVQGLGSITILKGGGSERIEAGTEFPIAMLGKLKIPRDGEARLSARTRKMMPAGCQDGEASPSQEVLQLMEARNQARGRKDWGTADQLRDRIAKIGWQVQDTSTEQVLIRKKKRE